MPANGGWGYGTNLDYMRELADYWVNVFDWRKAEANLNRYPQFKAEIDGTDIHFLHIKGSGDNPRPLIISHGWPGSFFEFFDIIQPLAHPERFGGNAEDAFEIVIPSLIGYGFSGKPQNPISPRTMARYFEQLMTDVLGLENYIAQGGDWGSVVSGWLGFEGRGCAAAHLNMNGWSSPGVVPETEEEKAAAERNKLAFEMEGAYFLEQASKPQTLSYAMMDSPVGVAAWFVEKFNTWSDIENDAIESRYTKDQLLTNIMIYLVTGSFNTATWLYNGLFTDPAGEPLEPGTRIEKPVGVANFPGDTVYAWPPRSQVERSMNVVHWTDMDRGGHFAAMEEPQLLIDDIRAFNRLI